MVRMPKKGEIVIYFPSHDENDAIANMTSGGLPAIVVHAWNNQTVDLRIFTNSEEPPLWKENVLKLNEPELHDMKPIENCMGYSRCGWIFQD